MTEVAEGIRNTRSVRDLARSVGVEMPITEQMYLLLYEGKPPPPGRDRPHDPRPEA
jgi:glycerol-3-phosphate dehydrogenase (NAD(P)+)